MTFRSGFIVLLFLWGAIVSAQTLSKDIRFNQALIRDHKSLQIIDVSGYEKYEFLAISIILEGPGINNATVRCAIKSKNNIFHLKPFEEEHYENKYVSELFYLPVIDVGRLVFEFEFNSDVRSDDVQGKIHFFAPNIPSDLMVTNNDIQLNALSSTCTCDKPTYIPRNIWGETFGLNHSIYTAPASYTDVTHLIVHHSAGIGVSNNWSSIVASIFDYHVRTNGWQDIGYNWLIDPNGVLYEGRGGGENVIGAHMCGYNSNTMGVCILGNFVTAKPSDKAIEALLQLLAWKSCKEDITPLGGGPIRSYYGNMAHISGHRDGCAPNYTECPGQALYVLMESLRLGTTKYIDDNCMRTNIDEVSTSGSWSFSPNPVEESVVLYSNQGIGKINFILTDHTGREWFNFKMTADDPLKIIDVSALPPGVYFVIGRQEKKISAQKIIKI